MKRRFAILCAILFSISTAEAFAQVTVQVGGLTVGTRSTLNLMPGGGILESCVDNPAKNRVDCTPSFNSAVLPTHDTAHGSENYCVSTNQTIAYACKMRYKALAFYSEGTTFLLKVDSTCVAGCSLNIDNLGAVNIKKNDGTSDPGGTLVAGQPQWIFYDGQVFRLMGGAAAGAAAGVADSRRDVIARRVIGSMENMQYGPIVAVEVTAGDLHKVLTSPSGGNSTFNATTAGLPGQHMWIIIANDTVSAKTITFGSNFRSSGPLTGATGKAATLQFVSDGTAWYEVGRTQNL